MYRQSEPIRESSSLILILCLKEFRLNSEVKKIFSNDEK